MADQWVGYGSMLKLIQTSAKENHEGNIIKDDTILTKLTLMD